MNRRGMALLLVLWLLVALSSVAGVTLAGTRVGNQASRNRLVLMRGSWAASACLAILRARYPGSIAGIDSVDLGQGVWCRVGVMDPGNFVRVADGREGGKAEGRAGGQAGRRTGGQADGREGGQADGREGGQADSGDSALFPVDPSSRRSAGTQHPGALTTSRGDGRVNLNTAPERVLATVPGMGDDGAKALAAARHGRALFRSPEEVVSVLPASVRERVMGRYAEFVAATTLSPTQFVAELEGHVGTGDLVSRATVTMVPAGNRLAIIRQEVE